METDLEENQSITKRFLDCKIDQTKIGFDDVIGLDHVKRSFEKILHQEFFKYEMGRNISFLLSGPSGKIFFNYLSILKQALLKLCKGALYM